MALEGAGQEEFERWYLASRNALTGAAFLYVGNVDEALDLTQETYARAWQHWDVVSGHANRDAWIRHVLHNLAVSRWRRLASRKLARRPGPRRTSRWIPTISISPVSSRGCPPISDGLSFCTSCSISPSTTSPTR